MDWLNFKRSAQAFANWLKLTALILQVWMKCVQNLLNPQGIRNFCGINHHFTPDKLVVFSGFSQ
ncbi:hypothetical protein ATN88_21545 [Enterovibrio coralii]|uniref:Uncharacterized protein n=1 Tax=Enterovibrio coralii TaxID=294935 RepID=A0A135IBB0_9GAMM|nr:hypothetical protein ATN88_21545 [Enterovibrio coralii]